MDRLNRRGLLAAAACLPLGLLAPKREPEPARWNVLPSPVEYKALDTRSCTRRLLEEATETERGEALNSALWILARFCDYATLPDQELLAEINKRLVMHLSDPPASHETAWMQHYLREFRPYAPLTCIMQPHRWLPSPVITYYQDLYRGQQGEKTVYIGGLVHLEIHKDTTHVHFTLRHPATRAKAIKMLEELQIPADPVTRQSLIEGIRNSEGFSREGREVFV